VEGDASGCCAVVEIPSPSLVSTSLVVGNVSMPSGLSDDDSGCCAVVEIPSPSLASKSIMKEILPVVEEFIDDVCTQQLLAYLRRLVLSLTRKSDHGFDKQLESILHDWQNNYQDRNMRDCREDLLANLSNILFNAALKFKMYGSDEIQSSESE
jgi:hypothetical protein